MVKLDKKEKIISKILKTCEIHKDNFQHINHQNIIDALNSSDYKLLVKLFKKEMKGGAPPPPLDIQMLLRSSLDDLIKNTKKFFEQMVNSGFSIDFSTLTSTQLELIERTIKERTFDEFLTYTNGIIAYKRFLTDLIKRIKSHRDNTYGLFSGIFNNAKQSINNKIAKLSEHLIIIEYSLDFFIFKFIDNAMSSLKMTTDNLELSLRENRELKRETSELKRETSELKRKQGVTFRLNLTAEFKKDSAFLDRYFRLNDTLKTVLKQNKEFAGVNAQLLSLLNELGAGKIEELEAIIEELERRLIEEETKAHPVNSPGFSEEKYEEDIESLRSSVRALNEYITILKNELESYKVSLEQKEQAIKDLGNTLRLKQEEIDKNVLEIERLRQENKSRLQLDQATIATVVETVNNYTSFKAKNYEEQISELNHRIEHIEKEREKDLEFCRKIINEIDERAISLNVKLRGENNALRLQLLKKEERTAAASRRLSTKSTQISTEPQIIIEQHTDRQESDHGEIIAKIRADIRSEYEEFKQQYREDYQAYKKVTEAKIYELTTELTTLKASFEITINKLEQQIDKVKKEKKLLDKKLEVVGSLLDSAKESYDERLSSLRSEFNRERHRERHTERHTERQSHKTQILRLQYEKQRIFEQHREAFQNLQLTKEELQSKRNILDEKDRQIRYLINEYKRLLEELESKHSSEIKGLKTNFSSERKGLNDNIQELTSEIKSNELIISKLNKEIEDLKRRNQDIENQLTENGGTLGKLNSEIEKNIARISELERKREALNEENIILKREKDKQIAESTQMSDNLNRKIAELEELLASKQELLLNNKATIQRLEREVVKKNIANAALETIKNNIVAASEGLSKIIDSLTKKIESLKSKNATLNKEIESLNIRNGSLTQEISKLQAEIATRASKDAAEEELRREIQKQIHTLNKDLAANAYKLEEKERELKETEKELTEKIDELESLKVNQSRMRADIELELIRKLTLNAASVAAKKSVENSMSQTDCEEELKTLREELVNVNLRQRKLIGNEATVASLRAENTNLKSVIERTNRELVQLKAQLSGVDSEKDTKIARLKEVLSRMHTQPRDDSGNTDIIQLQRNLDEKTREIETITQKSKQKEAILRHIFNINFERLKNYYRRISPTDDIDKQLNYIVRAKVDSGTNKNTKAEKENYNFQLYKIISKMILKIMEYIDNGGDLTIFEIRETTPALTGGRKRKYKSNIKQ